ncbi:MAG: ABC transporter substrate-binding protein [Anaerobacillus sp.]|uniref:ABC transporter substrate-binding protein n=1 Tax=Anaerobacillus sp. TaxID=1872506 RepID=UPI003918E0CD
MKKSKVWLMLLVFILSLSVIAACGGKDTPAPAETEIPNETPTGEDATSVEDVKGEITVLTNRTDIVNTTFQEYAKQFNEIYPDVKVNFEAITDYEGQVKIRMNTKDYGDVLLIPNDVAAPELGHFFEPLGSVEELSQKYLFTNEMAYDGLSYGIPVMVNAMGIVYNQKLFAEAGITELPNTPEGFLEAMQAIKDNTDATPYYTNYAAGWPLDQWENHRLSVAGEEDFVNVQLPNMDDPFSPGRPHYVIYKLMYDLAKQGLIENDPLTTDWETSKVLLAEGEIGAMVLGSWAIGQVQELAEDPNDIGYMPFPSNVNGTVYAQSGGDYKIGINVNSNNKEAARAWLDWFTNESNFALAHGAISPVKADPFPKTLSAFESLGVVLISEADPQPGQEGWVDLIDREAEVGLWQPIFKQRIIEAGIGNRAESFDDIMNDLNQRWAKAREKVTQ